MSVICITLGNLERRKPREDVAAGGRRLRPGRHQLVGLVDELLDSARVHVDAEEALRILQGEVDDVGVRRTHGREDGNLARQPGRRVAVMLPNLCEAHCKLRLPHPPKGAIVAEDRGDPCPHGHRCCIGVRGDRHVPQAALAHRDASAVVHPLGLVEILAFG